MLARACTPLTTVKKERKKRACSQSKSNVLGPTNTKLNEHVSLTHVTRYGGHEVLGFSYFLLARNVPSGEERRETDVFSGYLPHQEPLTAQIAGLFLVWKEVVVDMAIFPYVFEAPL